MMGGMLYVTAFGRWALQSRCPVWVVEAGCSRTKQRRARTSIRSGRPNTTAQGGCLAAPHSASDVCFAVSAHGKPVLQTALGPQGVQAARNLQWRALPDVPLEDFAVIADRLDDAVRPIIGEAERLPELALNTEQTAHIGRVGFEQRVDVLLGDAEFFGIDHGLVRPAHEILPAVIALADSGSERLLGNDFRQYDMRVRIGQAQPFGVKAR